MEPWTMANQVKHTLRRHPGAELQACVEEQPEVIAHQPGPLAEKASDAPFGLLGEFEAMFEYAPVAMILVNRQRQVLRVNRAARQFSAPNPFEWMDLPQGLFLGCPNRNDVSEGCGHGPNCSGCTVRQLIDRSFETRQAASPIEAVTPYAVEGRMEERRLRISTSHLTIEEGERTLLCIEDITERHLLPGGRGGELPVLPDRK